MFKLYKRKKFVKDKKRKRIVIVFLLFFIGGWGSKYSYSYFKHVISSKNNLKIKIGNVSVSHDKKVKEKINIEGLNPGESKEDLITIRNDGTLKAKIKLKFLKENDNLNKEFLSNFHYKILLKNSYKKSKETTGDLYNLLTMKEFIDVKNEKEKYIILNPKEELTIYFTLFLDKNIHYKYYNKVFDFSLDIISSQINNSI